MPDTPRRMSKGMKFLRGVVLFMVIIALAYGIWWLKHVLAP